MSERDHVFLDSHRPQLRLGRYTLDATLVAETETVCNASAQFFVGAERFSLGPAQVHSVYPPEGSRGSYGVDLPHIVLQRDTLPWERSANGDGAPWLALLLLTEEQSARHPLVTIGVQEYIGRLVKPLDSEPGQSPGDQVQTLELDLAMARSLLPTQREIGLLCHVRGDVAGDELSNSVGVVAGKCLPQPGKNTVHLVSLEGRYRADRPDDPIAGDAANASRCTVVSLKSWSFFHTGTGSASQSLSGLLQKLSSSWLRIPPDSKAGAANAYLSRGRAPLRHRSRAGESGVSWYSGPLLPGRMDEEDALPLPAKSADELLFYDSKIGMLDITYAAAWELGRLLALEHRQVEAALSAWRREQVLLSRRAEPGQAIYAHLPQIQRAAGPPDALPSVLTDWLRGLWRLDGVPFKYLVPDERMLPPESIRLFSVSKRWIEALIDGALSLTRPAGAERALLDAVAPSVTMSGFLLRSEVVSGWPSLKIEAAGGGRQLIPLQRRIQHSPSIVMCLFDGWIETLRIRQDGGTVHLAARQPGSPVPLDYQSSSELARDLLASADGIELSVAWEEEEPLVSDDR